MPLISIIIPVYNVEDYLRQCLDSVLDQTFTDYECILVDDGSPDSCPAICDEYAAKDRRFMVIHKENGGLSDARNVGIRTATGEYIVLLDSDDLLTDDNALTNLSDIIVKTKALVIFNSNITTFTIDNYSSRDGFNSNIDSCRTMQFYTETQRRRIALGGCFFTIHHNLLLQQDLFFKKGILHEDEHWIPRVMCSVEKIAINHNTFYSYRKGREGSITENIEPKNCFSKILIIEDLFLWIKNEKIINKQNLYKKNIVVLWLSVLYNNAMLSNKYSEEIKKIMIWLKDTYYILLYDKHIKHIILFLFIFTLGIKNAMNSYLFCKKLQRLVLFWI
jgi:glycosyltransferase involved in cell wall biosynthesis